MNNGPSDGTANFFFDYSTIGIPSAPSGAGTRGLKLQANQSNGIFSGVSASPNGQSFVGDYVVSFDWWANFHGPFPAGGNGSTQLSTFGIGTNGTVAQWPGGTQNSVWFGATGDGQSSVDWRAYSSAAPSGYTPASGVFAAGTGTAPDARNHSHPYYAFFGSEEAPAAQVALFPQQTGSTLVGSAGMTWHQVEIFKSGTFAFWFVDGAPIATIDLTTVTLSGDNIFFGHSDTNAASSTDPNDSHLLFTLIDNVLVWDDSTGGVLGDYNEDGKVDEADAIVWRKNETANSPLPNDDGLATQAERFDLWRANFGNMAMPASGAADSDSIPEPATIVLIFIAGLALLSCHRLRIRVRTCAILAALLTAPSNASYAAPTINIVPGGTNASGRLNAAGNFVWKVQIATSNPIPSGSSPMAAALGFKATGTPLLDANNLSTGAGDDFDTVIPGVPIWGWENPGTGTNGFPEGIQSNCAGGGCTESTPGDDPNTVFASLLSQIYGSPTTADFIEIITQGPRSGSLTSSISVSGVYGVGSNKGRIAEWSPSPPPDTINHDVYTGTFSFTAKPGDANLDGSVDAADYNDWLSHVGVPPAQATWYNGDFNNDDFVDSTDYNIWLSNIGSGAGSGDGSIVPEPASLLLVALSGTLLSSLRFCRTSKRSVLTNRFKVVSTVAIMDVAFLSVASSQAANLHLSVDYAGSYDAFFTPLPGSPPAPLFSQNAPHSGAPSAVHVPGAIHQFDVYMTITGLTGSGTTGQDFQSVIFDMSLGPGVTPYGGGAYQGENPQYDPPPAGGATQSLFSTNADAGPNTNDLKAITVIVNSAASHQGTHLRHPGEAEAAGTANQAYPPPALLGSVFVNWDGSYDGGSPAKSWVGVSLPQNVLNPWSHVTLNVGTAHPAADMTVGPREEWLSPNQSLPGDYNQNGKVDGADYVVWRNDPNRTQSGYNTWRAHFGQTLGAGNALGATDNAAVPEPNMLLLLCFGSLAVLWRR